MTREQAEWAKQHDWFVFLARWAEYYDWCQLHRDGNEGWLVVVRDDMVMGKAREFYDYNMLRAWAGY